MSIRTFGKLSEEQERVVQAVLNGLPRESRREVVDLGAGSMYLSQELLGLGARRVIAVDKEILASADPQIRVVRSTFEEFSAQHTSPIDVAFMSWPVNWMVPGLLNILKRSRQIIYLGSNVNASACGWPALWLYLQGRRIEHYCPDRRNSLIVYGADVDRDGSATLLRPMVGEEHAALVRAMVGEESAAMSGTIMTFPEAESATAQLKRIA